LDVLFFCFFKSTGVNKNEEIFPRKWINPFIHLWRKPIVQGSESISGKKTKISLYLRVSLGPCLMATTPILCEFILEQNLQNSTNGNKASYHRGFVALHTCGYIFYFSNVLSVECVRSSRAGTFLIARNQTL
jgi:hypothetical protein